MNVPAKIAQLRTGARPAKAFKYKTWKPREVVLVETLIAGGANYAEIACRIGVSKNAIASLVNNRIKPSTGDHARQQLLWRARQIVTAGYSVAEVVDLFGFDPDIAEAAFLEAYPEINQ